MIRTPRKLIAVALFLGAGTAAHALPVQILSGDVTIDYDLDNFTLNIDGSSVDSSVFSVIPVANGVRLEFGGYLNLYATSYFNYSPETKVADYSALFSFLPKAGKNIASYNITYEGGYSIETPGSVGIGGIGIAINESQGGSPFLVTTLFGGPSAPTLTGQLSATGEITYVQVLDGYQDVFVGYQDVLDYCEVEDPTICYYRQEPVYEQVPIYRDEMDLGEASIYLNSITISANAVPIPASAMLLGSALLGLGSMRNLKRRSVSRND